MPEINFDALVLKSDWAAALKSILDEAEVAIQGNDGAKKLALQAQLKTFIKRSPSKVDSLDDIALGAIDDLTLSMLSSAIASIQKRNQDLKAATAAIEAATTTAEKDAKALQLKNVIDALDRAKSAVETLKNLAQNLAQPDQDLTDRVTKISTAIEDLIALAKSKPTP